MDENFLSFLQIGFLNEGLPSGQTDEGHRGSLDHREVPWLEGRVILIERNEFCERADTVFAWPCVDFISRLEAAHRRSHLYDDAGEVISEHEWKSVG